MHQHDHVRKPLRQEVDHSHTEEDCVLLRTQWLIEEGDAIAHIPQTVVHSPHDPRRLLPVGLLNSLIDCSTSQRTEACVSSSDAHCMCTLWLCALRSSMRDDSRRFRSRSLHAGASSLASNAACCVLQHPPPLLTYTGPLATCIATSTHRPCVWVSASEQRG
jgi:hypothetical protein